MGLNMELADRLKRLPPYLFSEIDRAKREAVREGRDIIDLGVGDPDLPTPARIIDALSEAARDPQNHRYALDGGMSSLKEAIAGWYLKRFGVKLDPQTQILPLIGSKEGIAHFPLAFINPGDIALIPDPCYPPYRSGVIFAGGIPHSLPLLAEKDFLPALEDIPADVLKKAKLFYINYPNNPTAAVASKEYFQGVVEFARVNNLIVCHDTAYSEIAFDGFKPPSFLETEGSFDVGVEFHSLSKTYNMTGWRIGWACGNSEIISALSKVKSNIDSGIFQAVQVAGKAALEGDESCLKETVEVYRRRRDVVVDWLTSLGWSVPRPKATFYIWIPAPAGRSSLEICQTLLEKADIVVTPGAGFGESGRDFIRIALTVPEERLEEAVKRWQKCI